MQLIVGQTRRWAACLAVGLAVSACASTTTTRMAQNVVRIDASAAPACGRSGAIRLVNRMAAVETLRLGYDRYVIAAQDNQNNVRVVGYNSSTTGSFTGFGNSVNYSGMTTTTPIVGGSRDAAVVVMMFREGEAGSRDALDARTQLGENWADIVAEGAPSTCT